MRIYTIGLLSKWGLHDGDILDDLLFDNFGFVEELKFEHNVLIKVMEKYVIPQLDQKVKVTHIGTIHNPIRAKTVDGKEVNWFKENDFELTPTYIDIDDKKIIKIAKTIFNTLEGN